MNKLLRITLVAVFTVAAFAIAGSAQAGVVGGQNDAEDDISSSTEQAGSSSSGDAVGGQVVGVVSAGDASVDSTNRSEDVDVETGEASASNLVDQSVGQVNVAAGAENELEGGEISSDVSQAAEATSGDGVGGSVIGVVTAAGGSADVVAANTSEDVDIETGEAFVDNVDEGGAGVGQFLFSGGGTNEAEGDISYVATQSATGASGDGVGGQVIGVVSAGDASLDATNESNDVDIETGDAGGFNLVDLLVGQRNSDGQNDLEEGAEISSESNQVSESSTGDGVAGQVIGAVTSAGGTADIVAANTSDDVDVETGDSFADNFYFGLVGQTANDGGENDADDDISAGIEQLASAASGDGVGGQVLGVVSAGDTSVDATNESTDVDVETGLASSDNFTDQFTVGQSALGDGADNFSDGEISSEVAQESMATSGDAVGGQVAGVVTSVGGSADLVLANASDGVDAESGESFMFNELEEFVGQQTEGEGDV